jgi:ribosomal protein S18 acetylase RimI-like enzyme
MQVDVIVVWLELLRDDPVVESGPIPAGFTLERMPTAQPEVNRFLYTAVGADWHWVDQLGKPLSWWRDRAVAPGFETWILREGGSIAGYFELEPTQDGIELAYFGLLPAYARRRGLGGPLLCAAIARARESGAERITLNTCSFDHPAALANYVKRGFREVRRETFHRELPDRTPGPWPGWDSDQTPG